MHKGIPVYCYSGGPKLTNNIFFGFDGEHFGGILKEDNTPKQSDVMDSKQYLQ